MAQSTDQVGLGLYFEPCFFLLKTAVIPPFLHPCEAYIFPCKTIYLFPSVHLFIIPVPCTLCMYSTFHYSDTDSLIDISVDSVNGIISSVPSQTNALNLAPAATSSGNV